MEHIGAYTVYLKNASNGAEVANAIGSLYVNSFTNPGEEFYKQMFAKGRNVKHNFTMLCFEWFSGLARVTNYDERNQAAVDYAQKLNLILQNEQLNRQKMQKDGILIGCDFNYRDDKDAVRLIEKYLRLSEDNNAFIAQMRNAHRTNQQSFSRLCGRWFQYVSEHSEEKSKYVVMAKKAAELYCDLPLV